MLKAAGRVWTFVIVVVLIGAGAGLARASVDGLDSVRLVPSAVPGMLGPINGLGRAGWDCQPEKAAQSSSAINAELPHASDR